MFSSSVHPKGWQFPVPDSHPKGPQRSPFDEHPKGPQTPSPEAQPKTLQIGCGLASIEDNMATMLIKTINFIFF